MKVLHSGILASSYGGPALSTSLTLRGLCALGVEAELIQYPLRGGDVNRGEGFPIHYSKRVLVPKLGWVPSMTGQIVGLGTYDVYHAQGVWLWHTYALVDAARRLGRPYVITPRGMLYPQDIAKASTTFKRLSLRWRLLDDLNRAACVQVTCEEEMRHCRNLGVTSPIAVIPNPIEICTVHHQKQDSIFRVGYLGRLQKRKNVQALLYAFATLGDEAQSAELLIIGGGEPEYEQFLRTETERLGLKNVKFVGFLNGEARDGALASCSVLVLPSEFENLGNVIMEALVRRIPCIATKGSPWQELETWRCGWWVDFDQQAITEAIREALHTPEAVMREMGDNGRRLMEKRYEVSSIARRMKSLYEWILGQGEKPDYVYQIEKNE